MNGTQARDFFQDVVDLPSPPSAIDLDQVVAKGRRRRAFRRGAIATAAVAVTVAAVTALALLPSAQWSDSADEGVGPDNPEAVEAAEVFLETLPDARFDNPGVLYGAKDPDAYMRALVTRLQGYPLAVADIDDVQIKSSDFSDSATSLTMSLKINGKSALVTITETLPSPSTEDLAEAAINTCINDAESSCDFFRGFSATHQKSPTVEVVTTSNDQGVRTRELTTVWFHKSVQLSSSGAADLLTGEELLAIRNSATIGRFFAVLPLPRTALEEGVWSFSSNDGLTARPEDHMTEFWVAFRAGELQGESECGDIRGTYDYEETSGMLDVSLEDTYGLNCRAFQEDDGNFDPTTIFTGPVLTNVRPQPLGELGVWVEFLAPSVLGPDGRQDGAGRGSLEWLPEAPEELG